MMTTHHTIPMQFPPAPSYFFSLKPKYLPHNPILEYPQPMFLL